MQRLCELLVEQLHLVHMGLEVPLHRGLFEVLRRQGVVSHLAAILAPGPPPGIGPGVGEVQCRIGPQLGKQVQVALSPTFKGLG